MSSNDDSRRDALKIIGAIGATCAFPFSADELYGQSAQHANHSLVQVKQAVPAAARYFDEARFNLISRIAGLIIPETETPGAIAAGVPSYIDYVVGSNQRHQPIFRDGLSWLDERARSLYGKPFIDLKEDLQISLLQPLSDAIDSRPAESPGEHFFQAIKSLTSDGYFTSKAGLMDNLGYKGNSLVVDFPGCTHEH